MGRTLLAALALALLVSGCGTSEDGETAAPSSPPAGATTVEETGTPATSPTSLPSPTAAATETASPSAAPTPTAAASPTVATTETQDGGDEAAGDGGGEGANESPGVAPATASKALRSWIAALAEGDTDAAWDLTAEASREAVGGREGFESLSSGLAEGWGAWASTDATYTETVVVSAGGDQLAVVAVSGTVTQEGMTERRASALPVPAIAGNHLVNPFVGAEGFAIEFEEPGDGTLAAYVPAATEVTFAIDGRAVDPETEGADGDRQRASILADLPPGEHVLAVIYQGPAGVGADALLFEIG